MTFFDFCYEYLILYDNDKMTPVLKEEMFQRLKTIFFQCREPFFKQMIVQHKNELCSRPMIKNIMIYMYENIRIEKNNSIFYQDLETSKEMDSFLRLMYLPIQSKN